MGENVTPKSTIEATVDLLREATVPSGFRSAASPGKRLELRRVRIAPLW